jgi:hypothetical protein
VQLLTLQAKKIGYWIPTEACKKCIFANQVPGTAGGYLLPVPGTLDKNTAINPKEMSGYRMCITGTFGEGRKKGNFHFCHKFCSYF